MPLFSIEQTYTKELYKEYAWCAYYKLKSFKKLVITIMVVVISLAVACIWFHRYMIAGMLVIAAPIYMLIMKKAANDQIKSSWESNTIYHNMTYHIDFYDTYFETITENGTNKVEYEKLYGILESDHVFALMLGNNQGTIMEKSKMSDELIHFLKSKAKIIG
ncbi:MAG: YcxB family protein [Lachnospiraceae bacterium]